MTRWYFTRLLGLAICAGLLVALLGGNRADATLTDCFDARLTARSSNEEWDRRYAYCMAKHGHCTTDRDCSLVHGREY